MPAFVSKKLSIVLLACSWCVAAALVLAADHALAGPRLGRLYDFLLGFRSPPPVSGQILLINTDEAAEPGDVFSVLMALSEFGASDLLVEVPVLGARAGMAESAAEFTRRIDGEFGLLSANIRSLFDAIRMGLLGPEESPGYVESLVELAERGRDRLNTAIMRGEEDGDARVERAMAVFGRATTAKDLRAQPWAAPEGEIPWYSRPRPDGDGKLRRIAPIVPRGGLERALANPPAAGALRADGPAAEHIAFRALGRRWTESVKEPGGAGNVLVNRFELGGGTSEFRFPLDRDGNILFERPGRGAEPGGFRSIGLETFREYERAERTMARLLAEAWNLGLYAEIRPERIPTILFERAEYLAERLLEVPDAQAKAAWLAARNDYIKSIDEFLYGPSEMILVNGYEITIAAMTGEGLDERAIDGIRHRRNTVIRAFVSMREAHRELLRLRELLAETVEASFCIMSPPAPGGTDASNASALLANALLTGRSITPGQSLHVILWSLAASIAVLTLVHALGSGATPVVGLAGGLLCLAGFGAAFIVSGYWIDPLISASAVLGGTLFLSVSRLCIVHFRLLRFYREEKAKERWVEFYFGEGGKGGTPRPGKGATRRQT